jgi:hypothetical protein
MTDQDRVQNIREELAAGMIPETFRPATKSLLRLLDAERAKSAELQVKLDAAIAEGCEHAADLSACRLANKLLAETFIRETEQYASRQRVHESYLKVMDSVWDGHQKQFDEQAKEIDAARKECDEAIEALRPFICEKVRLIHPGNEAHLAVRVGAIHAATEIVQRHDESKKGGE